MLCSVSLQPCSLRFRKMIVRKVIIEKASDNCALDLALLDLWKLTVFLQPMHRILLCCAITASFLQSYNTCAPSTRPEKSPSVSEMFVLKLANLTKIILKTLSSVGLQPSVLLKAKIYLFCCLFSTSTRPWITTGLFPQFFSITFPDLMLIQKIQITGRNGKHFK